MPNTAPKRNEAGEVPRPKGACNSIPDLHKAKGQTPCRADDLSRAVRANPSEVERLGVTSKTVARATARLINMTQPNKDPLSRDEIAQ